MAPRQSVAERGNAQRNRGLEGFYAAAGNSLVDLFLFFDSPEESLFILWAFREAVRGELVYELGNPLHDGRRRSKYSFD